MHLWPFWLKVGSPTDFVFLFPPARPLAFGQLYRCEPVGSRVLGLVSEVFNYFVIIHHVDGCPAGFPEGFH